MLSALGLNQAQPLGHKALIYLVGLRFLFILLISNTFKLHKCGTLLGQLQVVADQLLQYRELPI